MAKKFNNAKLLIALVAVIFIFFIVRAITNRHEKSFKANLSEDIDSTKITAIIMYPTSEKREEIKLVKNGITWNVIKKNLTFEAEQATVDNLVKELVNLKTQQVVSNNKDKWKEYMVTDSTGTRVKVFEGSDVKLDIVVGKFNYQKSNNPYAQYGGGINGSTCVRLFKDREVYTVKGFLSFMFNQPFNNWRNQKFIKATKTDITKITASYPGDSGFIAEKKGSEWMISGIEADSLKMDRYLSALSWSNKSSFVDDYIPSGNPEFKLNIEGNNLTSMTIEAYKKSDTEYILHSSLNPKTYFSSNNKALSDIFKRRMDLIKTETKK